MHNLIIRILAVFILSKKKRQAFRTKYLHKTKKNGIESLPLILEKKIDKISRAILYSLPPARGQLRKLQLQSLSLLKSFSKFCKENEIPFWIQGGTLLGAVRHGGFIPWDDDIDCGILRDDFEKLESLLSKSKVFQLMECYNFIPDHLFACRMYKVIMPSQPEIFIDLFLYDRIQIDNPENIQKVWNKYVDERKNLTQELLNLGFANQDCPIEDEDTRGKVRNIFSKYVDKRKSKVGNYIIFGIDNLAAKFQRLYHQDMIFPLREISFEDENFLAPQDKFGYLKRQYGNIYEIPTDIGRAHHLDNDLAYRKAISEKSSNPGKKIIGYTAGAFDVFHIGHLNLIKKAKENCDYLIVGVTTDDLVYQTKHKWPLSTLSERMEILSSLKYVDKVVLQDDLNKVRAWEKYRFHKLFSGDDWKNAERWKNYEKQLLKVGCETIYFPYTKNISSSKIQNFVSKNMEDK